MANPKYHPIPSSRPQSKRAKRTAQSADWNLPRRRNRTPRGEYAFMREYALPPGFGPSEQRGGGQ